jgi:hypothetical protein
MEIHFAATVGTNPFSGYIHVAEGAQRMAAVLR